MVQVTCEKTGVVFEAPTKRTKNHPAIMAAINEAYSDGWYAQAMETIQRGRQEKWATIDLFVSSLKQTREDFTAARKVAIHEQTVREFAIRDAKRDRATTNAFLRKHGYRWKKFENDEEDQDFFKAPAVEWDLYSPENKIVSVRTAMEQLASTSNYARQWLESHPRKEDK